MSDEQHPTPASGQPVGPLVHQSHGGAIRRGNNRRLKDPTPADVRARSRKAYYSTIPKLARIARNQVTGGALEPIRRTA